MTHTVAINEFELMFIELFRVALSAPTHEQRLDAIRWVKHDVIAARLKDIAREPGPDWVDQKKNRELVEWVARTSGIREDAVYQLSRIASAYDGKLERPLNVAEQVGKLIRISIAKERFEGVQTRNGILYQVRHQGKTEGISGAQDKDTVRKAWGSYRGVVHLGMALDYCEERSAPLEEVVYVAEHFRSILSTSCPKRTKKPYVDPEEQISFVFISGTSGPRFLNRGLPFYVDI